MGPRLLPEQDVYGTCTLERVRQVIVYGSKQNVCLWRIYPRARAPDERFWHMVAFEICYVP